MLVFTLSTLVLIQNRLREEHALQDVLYKTLMKGAPTALPPRSVSHVLPRSYSLTKYHQTAYKCCITSVALFREDAASEPLNACRIYGHVYVNKVAGNLHITVGK